MINTTTKFLQFFMTCCTHFVQKNSAPNYPALVISIVPSENFELMF